MKHIIAAAALVSLIGVTTANAQLCCRTQYDVCCYYNQPVTIGSSNLSNVKPFCDDVNKTPREAIVCKLDYWKEETASLNKRRDDLDKLIKAANERVDAFAEALKGAR